MRMLTMRPAALLGLLVLGVLGGAAATGCGVGHEARMRRDHAQGMMGARYGVTPGAASAPQAAAPGGAGGAANDAAKLGLQIATANGCVACHTPNGQVSVGPTWKGVFDSNRELVSGSPVKADDAYLKESILNPNAKIVKGFLPNLMPATFATTLKPEQIDQLIAYIKTLK